MPENDQDNEILTCVTKIVSAYLSNNKVETNDLEELIATVYKGLDKVKYNVSSKSMVGQNPAVPIKKSIFPDYIICLEDGKKLKMLKRHLKSAYDLTPEQYREKWGLAHDYPMVAPNYAKQRSELAKGIGLGKS